MKIIYAASYAFGFTYNGISFVNVGGVSVFSGYVTKDFEAIEGGAATLLKAAWVPVLKDL